jgi:hypothetical protein
LRNYGFGLKFNQPKTAFTRAGQGAKKIKYQLEIDTRTNWVKELAPVTAWFPLRSWRALREPAFPGVIVYGRFAHGREKIY